jgi:IS1 family transposase
VKTVTQNSCKKMFCWEVVKGVPFCVFQARNTGGNSAIIVGLTDKESNITDPWNHLYQLIQMVAGQQQWKFARSLLGEK